MKKIIAPSILACNQSCFGKEVQDVSEAGADWIHIDIMDGHFVPNISFGPDVVKHVRGYTDKIFDCHLMIDPVSYLIEPLVKAGVDRISTHVETKIEQVTNHLNIIKKHNNIAVGLAINPNTPVNELEPFLDGIDQIIVMGVMPGFGGQAIYPDTFDRVAVIKEMIQKKDILIQVDGGVTIKNSKSLWDAGADILVAGSEIFGSSLLGSKFYKKRIDSIRGL